MNPDNCWIPLIDANGVANVELDDAGRFTVYVEAASNPLVEADLPFAPMNLGERADGRPSDYVLTTMDVCAFNQNVFDYLMDLETVTSLMRELKDDDPRYWQLAKALQRSLNTYDERDIAGTLEPAKEKLARVLSEPAYSSVIHHVAVGHAHIDSAWLWPVRETHRKVARTVSNVLALMDEDPDFTYAMSSAQQYAWLEQEHPDLFARMLQRIKEGRFIPVGGMWVESDNMLPTGESLMRQMRSACVTSVSILAWNQKDCGFPTVSVIAGHGRKSHVVPVSNGSSHRRSHGTTPRNSPPFLRMGRHRRIANPYALPAVGHVRLDRKYAGTAVFPAQLP